MPYKNADQPISSPFDSRIPTFQELESWSTLSSPNIKDIVENILAKSNFEIPTPDAPLKAPIMLTDIACLSFEFSATQMPQNPHMMIPLMTHYLWTCLLRLILLL